MYVNLLTRSIDAYTYLDNKYKYMELVKLTVSLAEILQLPSMFFCEDMTQFLIE